MRMFPPSLVRTHARALVWTRTNESTHACGIRPKILSNQQTIAQRCPYKHGPGLQGRTNTSRGTKQGSDRPLVRHKDSPGRSWGEATGWLVPEEDTADHSPEHEVRLWQLEGGFGGGGA